MFAPVEVNGDGRHPLYAELTKTPDATGKAGKVTWNFEKFVITPDDTVHRFRPKTVPDAPEIIQAAAAQGLTVTSAREQAANLGITLRELLGLDEAPVKEVVITYVKNGPLVEPAQEKDLPPQMKGLLKWYKGYIKNKNAKEYIYAEVRHEHHFKHYYVQIELSELFQLFNLRELDKSIISCYVL